MKVMINFVEILALLRHICVLISSCISSFTFSFKKKLKMILRTYATVTKSTIFIVCYECRDL